MSIDLRFVVATHLVEQFFGFIGGLCQLFIFLLSQYVLIWFYKIPICYYLVIHGEFMPFKLMSKLIKYYNTQFSGTISHVLKG